MRLWFCGSNSLVILLGDIIHVLVKEPAAIGICVVGGTLYDAPPEGIGAIVSDIQRVGNDALSQLTVQTGGGRYTLAEIYLDEDRATLVLR